MQNRGVIDFSELVRSEYFKQLSDIGVAFTGPHFSPDSHIYWSSVSSYKVQVLSLTLRPTIKKREEERRSEIQPSTPKEGGEGVISREAVMASLQQNRKHYETGLFTTTKARSMAQSTLAPFSHPHILWNSALSATRLLCPHRRSHKKPSIPPISTQARPL